jgi:hypothetical protein
VRFSGFVTDDGAVIVARDDGRSRVRAGADPARIADAIMHSPIDDDDEAVDWVLASRR